MAKRVVPVLAAVAASLVLAMLAGLWVTGAVARQSRDEVAAMAGALEAAGPQVTAEAMRQLKEADEALVAEGREVLARYGYSEGVFAGRVRPAVLLAVGGLALGLVAAFLLLALWGARRRKKRLGALETLLASAEAGGETLPVGTAPDEFRFLEDEIGKTVSALRQSRETALAERARLAENLADIAHQIKTPVTSISLMTQLLADEAPAQPDGAATEYLDKLSRQTVRLEALVSALLTLSRLDAGAIQLEEKPVEAGAMLLAALEPVDMQIAERGQHVDIQDDGAVYTGDFAWSAEAFLNLIKNCSEHTPAGGHITLRCESNPLYAQITVEDDGTGFAPEDLPRLFQRFYRGAGSKQGIGIGLAMARTIIQRQNGSLTAANRPQGGARFVAKFYH